MASALWTASETLNNRAMDNLHVHAQNAATPPPPPPRFATIVCHDCLTIENTETSIRKCTRCIMQIATCTCQTFLSKTFAKSLSTQKTEEKHFGKRVMMLLVFDKSTDHDKPYFDCYVLFCLFVFFFYDNINMKEKCFLSERELKKHCPTHLGERRGWDLVIFDWLILSKPMQVIMDSFFARPGSVPIWDGKKGELRDWTKQSQARKRRRPMNSIESKIYPKVARARGSINPRRAKRIVFHL